MDASRWTAETVFLYRKPVDMRKGAAGLAALVQLELGRDPADRCLYVFINRSRNKVKLLIWHLNGYWVLYKSIEKQRFHWPDWFDDDCMTLEHEQLDYLIDGYNLNGMQPHKALSFARAF
ncbi:MAG: IS66 family insertion sequence element accessory protein TnpB [Granulosicoccaceae bacterium]